jgi:hypothetical protein
MEYVLLEHAFFWDLKPVLSCGMSRPYTHPRVLDPPEISLPIWCSIRFRSIQEIRRNSLTAAVGSLS